MYSKIYKKTKKYSELEIIAFVTGKSFSEALILGSTNPQYDRRLFIDLQVQYMKIPSSEHGENVGIEELHLQEERNS